MDTLTPTPTDITRADLDHTIDIAYVAGLAYTAVTGRLDPVVNMARCLHVDTDTLTTTLLMPDGCSKPAVQAALRRLAVNRATVVDVYRNPLGRWLVMVTVDRTDPSRIAWENAARQTVTPGDLR